MGRTKKRKPEDIIQEALVEWVILGVMMGAIGAFVLTYIYTAATGLQTSRSTQGLATLPGALAYWAFKTRQRWPRISTALHIGPSADVRVGKQELSGGSVAPVVGGYKPTIILQQKETAKEPTFPALHDLTPSQRVLLGRLVRASKGPNVEPAFSARNAASGWEADFHAKDEAASAPSITGFAGPDLLRLRDTGYVTLMPIGSDFQGSLSARALTECERAAIA